MQVCSQKNSNPALDTIFFNADGVHRKCFSFTFVFSALSIPFVLDPLVTSHCYFGASPKRVTDVIIFTQHHLAILNSALM